MRKNKTSLLVIAKILKEIDSYKDLKEFQKKNTDKYCKQYNVAPSQLNFLISVIAVQRVEKEKKNEKR